MEHLYERVLWIRFSLYFRNTTPYNRTPRTPRRLSRWLRSLQERLGRRVHPGHQLSAKNKARVAPKLFSIGSRVTPKWFIRFSMCSVAPRWNKFQKEKGPRRLPGAPGPLDPFLELRTAHGRHLGGPWGRPGVSWRRL